MTAPEPEFSVGDHVVHYVPEVGIRERGEVNWVRTSKTRVSYDVLFRHGDGRLKGLLKEVDPAWLLPLSAVERLGDLGDLAG